MIRCARTRTADSAFAGAIVVCQRGVNARVEKSFNVAQRGGVGMILYNPVLQGLSTDNHFVPTVHLENDAGAALLAFLGCAYRRDRNVYGRGRKDRARRRDGRVQFARRPGSDARRQQA